jgi:WD40 repeat protein
VAGTVRIGPAAKLQVDGFLESVSLDRDGRTLTVARMGPSGGATFLELESPATTIRHVTHPIRTTSASMSPDGRWFTTAVHAGLGVRVWDASTGQQVTELISNEHNTRADFSPDGKWLLTRSANEISLWSVGSWERTQVLRPERGVDGPGSAAFSSDGKLLALTISAAVVQLIDVANWRPLARLQGPEQDQVMVIGFLPDGGRLVVARAAGGVHVWDLRLIREQLQTLGLDWNFPSFPFDAAPHDDKPLRVEVEVGEFSQSQKR